ncbi:MAG: hypothetical protein EAX86_07605 [Candidatus Heimdallarchaeota archaeon]|nr:hypothetical protein [Candidatus Heimdallarchaeota archaeon]
MEINWLIPSSQKKEGLRLGIAEFIDVSVSKDLAILADSQNKIFQEIRKKYTTETLKDSPLIRAYRDFYWKWGIADPTKVRPASEALIRRILIKNNIWKINTFVNAYNLASAASGISLGAYDKLSIKHPLNVRFAESGEAFWGIGMNEPKPLSHSELVLSDQEGIICIFPHRDAERTKITLNTQAAYLIAFGVPGISKIDLNYAFELAQRIIEENKIGKLNSITFC